MTTRPPQFQLQGPQIHFKTCSVVAAIEPRLGHQEMEFVTKHRDATKNRIIYQVGCGDGFDVPSLTIGAVQRIPRSNDVPPSPGPYKFPLSRVRIPVGAAEIHVLVTFAVALLRRCRSACTTSRNRTWVASVDRTRLFYGYLSSFS